MIPKYRIWHKARKQMFTVSTIDFRQEKISYIDGSGFAGAFISLDDVILMQSTGLTDTNGVEIFDGDILKLNKENSEATNANQIMSVGFSQDIAGFATCDHRYLWLYAKPSEIIGNIHQNPELLEK